MQAQTVPLYHTNLFFIAQPLNVENSSNEGMGAPQNVHVLLKTN